jgi:DNA transformation protein and related proteins
MDDETIRELFEAFGPVSIRRMFGGKGIYRDGLIFALVLRDELMLKGDELNAPEWESEGAARWTYRNSKGKPVAMPYWSVPVDVLEDRDSLTSWAREAFSAALRAEQAKRGPEF